MVALEPPTVDLRTKGRCPFLSLHIPFIHLKISLHSFPSFLISPNILIDGSGWLLSSISFSEVLCGVPTTEYGTYCFYVSTEAEKGKFYFHSLLFSVPGANLRFICINSFKHSKCTDEEMKYKGYKLPDFTQLASNRVKT